MVVLLILAVVWAAVLGPSVLRRRAERRSTDSIGAFHRQLRVLQRTGPSIVDPAYRLATTYPSRRPFHMAGVHSAREAGGPEEEEPPLQASSGRVLRRSDPYFRADACRRRRNILVSLLALSVGTGLLGAIPSLRPALFVAIAGAVLLAAYVGLLLYLRNLAMEREDKLRYLPSPIEPQAPAAIRRVVAR